MFSLGIELNGLIDKETVYLDLIKRFQDMTRTLKEDEQCYLIIFLSHLGYNYTKNLGKICGFKIGYYN